MISKLPIGYWPPSDAFVTSDSRIDSWADYCGSVSISLNYFTDACKLRVLDLMDKGNHLFVTLTTGYCWKYNAASKDVYGLGLTDGFFLDSLAVNNTPAYDHRFTGYLAWYQGRLAALKAMLGTHVPSVIYLDVEIPNWQLKNGVSESLVKPIYEVLAQTAKGYFPSACVVMYGLGGVNTTYYDHGKLVAGVNTARYLTSSTVLDPGPICYDAKLIAGCNKYTCKTPRVATFSHLGSLGANGVTGWTGDAGLGSGDLDLQLGEYLGGWNPQFLYLYPGPEVSSAFPTVTPGYNDSQLDLFVASVNKYA